MGCGVSGVEWRMEREREISGATSHHYENYQTPLSIIVIIVITFIVIIAIIE
jgi:hypothetical protein